MSKVFRLIFSVAAVLAVSAISAFAAEGGASAEGSKWAVYLAAGLGMGIAAFGTGLGQGKAVASAVEGISRNPGASGKIMTPMIIGLAMIESLAIYALVVALILLFVV
ncbi:MAG: F-type H+-transporting ATPase subunit c [Deferribacteres bacterium]|jgi:F-type H+-transporting ATPase subunit c|nr:F-type H+-transporting ATPase subunit c [Deferribacteres bacterium]